MPKPRLMQKTSVNVSEVETTNRLRPVSEVGVASLIASIEELGVMKDPIHVRQKKGGALVLIAGGHRLEAATRLGWQEIEAKVWTDVTDDWARLMEIDDNLAGAEMNVLDSAVFLAERKRVYEKLHPETKAGVSGGLARQGLANDMLSFAAATAEKFGVSKRKIERIVAAGYGLAPDEVSRLRRAPKAVSLSDLQLIGKLGPSDRYVVVDALANGTAKSAAKAHKAAKHPGTTVLDVDPHEVAFQKLAEQWTRSSAVARRRFMASFGDQVVKYLPERGEDTA
ncbi:ParB/RepB/Spo0J family partition protein [Maritimibacter alkaliphilus]|uniref:ParB/RepB/Spo0J family partition protein n=1 Tax=Maritimibacter alkaliphilus TaxID=404236 RepID=UPI001C97A762|nr:ParB N-terminal domain-containing protein [Maritimibacter alkaliphilus]MBY6091045.1 ParB N-terminal domain-containing protein [Maritimibacter alkaliphilus]